MASNASRFSQGLPCASRCWALRRSCATMPRPRCCSCLRCKRTVPSDPGRRNTPVAPAAFPVHLGMRISRHTSPVVKMKMKAARENTLRYTLLALALLSGAALLQAWGQAQAQQAQAEQAQAQPQAKAQAPLSAEEARFIEFGKEIFKSKAVCQYCHKWDASG